MKYLSLEIPEKMFGIESALIVLFVPIVVIILLMIVSFNLVVTPKIEDYNRVQAKLSSVKNQTEKVVEKTKYLQAVDTEELNRNAARLNNALLPQKNAYLLVGVVGKIATRYGYQIDSFVINPGKLGEVNSGKTDVVLAIPVNLTLVGPREAYLSLINGLEKSLPVLAIENMKMSNDKETAKIEMGIKAFYIEPNRKVDVAKMTLADLTLKKEENELLTRLGQFQVIENVRDREVITGDEAKFQNFGRVDPFSL